MVRHVATFANALAPRECFSESVPMNLFFPGMCMFLACRLLGLRAQSTSIKDTMVANE